MAQNVPTDGPLRRSWDKDRPTADGVLPSRKPCGEDRIREAMSKWRRGNARLELSPQQIRVRDVLELEFRIPKTGTDRYLSIVFDVDSVGTGGAYGAVYLTEITGRREKVELVTPISFLPLPLKSEPEGRRNLAKYFSDWIGEDNVTEKDITGFIVYRKIPEPSTKSAGASAKTAGRVEGIVRTEPYR